MLSLTTPLHLLPTKELFTYRLLFVIILTSHFPRNGMYRQFNACLVQVLDEDLDGAALRVSRSLKSFDCIFNRKSVRNQLRQIDNTRLDESDGAWPRVGIAVLHLNVDLPNTGAHEGDVDLCFADTNDEYLAAKLGGPDGRSNAALHACTLHRHSRLEAAKRLDDSLAPFLRRQARLNQVSNDARAQLFGEGQSALGDVGDDQRRGSRCRTAHHCDETDWAGTANKDRVA